MKPLIVATVIFIAISFYMLTVFGPDKAARHYKLMLDQCEETRTEDCFTDASMDYYRCKGELDRCHQKNETLRRQLRECRENG